MVPPAYSGVLNFEIQPELIIGIGFSLQTWLLYANGSSTISLLKPTRFERNSAYLARH